MLGVAFFPNMPTGASAVPQPPTACVDQADNVDLAPLGPAGSTQRGAIDQAFSSLTIPADCGTPTLDAYRLALAPMAETSLPPDKFLLLVTDGQPTYAGGCVGDGTPTSDSATLQALTDPIVAEIGNAFAAGSRTFVIGLPGSAEGSTTGFDARAWLSAAARAGGTARADCSDTGSPSSCHFDLATSENLAQDLGDVLAGISPAIASCKYRVPQPDGGVVDVSKLDLLYQAGDGNRYLVVRNLASNCQLGWHFTDDTKTQMEICGSTCDRDQERSRSPSGADSRVRSRSFSLTVAPDGPGAADPRKHGAEETLGAAPKETTGTQQSPRRAVTRWLSCPAAWLASSVGAVPVTARRSRAAVAP